MLSHPLQGQKVVVVGVPGAFTGVCSQSHIPGYINALPELRELGVERLLCVSVNDPYTMCAWSNKMGLTEPSAGNWGLWVSLLPTYQPVFQHHCLLQLAAAISNLS